MILLPSLLAAEAGGRKRFELEADTVGAALRALPVADLLFDERGTLRPLVNVYVDGADVRVRGGLETRLSGAETVRVVAAVAGGSSGAAADPQERERLGGGRGLGEACRVIVLNDHHNTFEGVAAALAAVLPGVTYEQGLQLANRIHFAGSAVVWTGHREAAELYWQQLKDTGLTMAPLEC